MTKVFRSTLAVATVLAVAGVHKANATPVYAFASLGLTNLTIKGLPLTGASVTTTTSANYPGSARQRFVSRGDPVGCSSRRLAFQRSLGDLCLRGQVDHGRHATSSSGTSTTILITPVAITTFNLSFSASANLSAVFQTSGDSALASTNFSFHILDLTTGSFVNITDNINAANSGHFIIPGGLNQTVTAFTLGSPQNLALSASAFSYTASLVANDLYQIVITDGTTETLCGRDARAIHLDPVDGRIRAAFRSPAQTVYPAPLDRLTRSLLTRVVAQAVLPAFTPGLHPC